MEGYCRGCLSKFDDPVELLQYTEERRRLFVYSTSLQVKRNDTFTFQLCKDCYYSMKTSCKFKKMCRTSDKKIENYLTLKDEDDGMDFSTFLARNEDSITFRLPILSGASTPANNKTRDDDNESTCTSIQNFMTDILRADEIPDSEARIIREVIEEEADVLEDSLDSHWLNEDGLDECQLDLSLSRFSTPKSTNHERMSSPTLRELTSTDVTSGEDYDNIPINVPLKQLSDPVDKSLGTHNVLEVKGQNDTKKMKCVIDKNLEKALKDETNQEFSLQELLASPVFPSQSGASTPTIKHIIFGDKVKSPKKSKSPKFEPDLESIVRKLEKGMNPQEQVQWKKFDPEVEILGKGLKGVEQKGKIDIDLEAGKVLEEKQKLGAKNNVEQEKRNIEGRKIFEGKLFDLTQFSAGKLLQEKLNASKIQLNEEKKRLKIQVGEFYEDYFVLDDFDIEKVEERPGVENLNEVQDDGKIQVDIEALLEDNDRDMDVVNDPENLQMELFGDPGQDLMGEDSDEDVLEELLSTENEKLANVEMKKKAVMNLANAAHRDDTELTDLLQEAYDQNVEIIKGNKLINAQIPKKGVKSLKKMFSLVENKYCIINFYCKMCELKFESLKALKIHFTKSHRYHIETPKNAGNVMHRMCDLCGKIFTNPKSLEHHLKNHDKKSVYSCEKCSLTFKTEHNLNNHRTTHGTKSVGANKLNDLQLKYVCQICGAVSTSASNHAMHERRHSKSYTLHCEDCGRGFYRRFELNTHMRQHTGEKPFSCMFCDQSFARRDTLNRHLKCHTDEKMFSCQYCSERFKRSYDVKMHQKTNKVCLELRGH